MDREFFSETELLASGVDIFAAEAEGVIAAWNVDGNGVQWFRSTQHSKIKGVPPTTKGAVVDARLCGLTLADAKRIDGEDGSVHYIFAADAGDDETDCQVYSDEGFDDDDFDA